MANIYSFNRNDKDAPYVYVATSTSAKKTVADYICTGTSDNIVIQNAINSLPSGGGTVCLLEGTYTLTGVLNLPIGVNLIGMGTNATILQNPTTTSSIITCNGYNKVDSFKLTGDKSVSGNFGISFATTANNGHNTISNILFYNLYTAVALPDASASNSTITDCYFDTCYGCVRFTGSTTINNVKVLNCDFVNYSWTGLYLAYTNSPFVDNCYFSPLASTTTTDLSLGSSVKNGNFNNINIDSANPTNGCIYVGGGCYYNNFSNINCVSFYGSSVTQPLVTIAGSYNNFNNIYISSPSAGTSINVLAVTNTYNRFVSCTISGNSATTCNLANVSASNTEFIGCYFRTSNGKAINTTSAGQYLIVSDCFFYGITAGTINLAGSNVKISGCSFDGCTGGQCINIGSANHIEINNCKFNNQAGSGIYIIYSVSTNFLKVTGNMVSSATPSFLYASSVNDFIISDNDIEYSSASTAEAITIASCNYGTISGNVIFGLMKTGINIAGLSTQIDITGNTFKKGATCTDATNYGITLNTTNVTKCNVSDNIFDTYNSGVYSTAQYITVSGNQITGDAGAMTNGIFISSQSTASNNMLTGTFAYGIYTSSTSDVVCSGNIISGACNYAIGFNSVTNGNITGNFLNGKFGINAVSCQYLTITGNTVKYYNNALNSSGIFSSSTCCVISNNTVYKNTGTAYTSVGINATGNNTIVSSNFVEFYTTGVTNSGSGSLVANNITVSRS